tara:strand:- start:70 stop:567 length:498 start_codon:yes stop_codon:yes gene_type:complete
MKFTTAMTTMLLMIGGAVAFALWPGEKSREYTLSIGPETSAKGRAVVEGAFKVLVRNCEGIGRYWPSFAAAEAVYYEGNRDYRAERYGWSELARFRFQIKEEPQMGLTAASGHTLHLVAGAGRLPGVTATKTWTKELCGMAVSTDDDQWRSIPAMADAFAGAAAR